MSEPELIVYATEDGVPTGKTAPKLEAHTSETGLHLAFSAYVFDTAGRFLVTQRASTKKVWPGVWTNSCCGHPMPGESNEAAIGRRLEYELGMYASDPVVLLPRYRYKTPPYAGIIENEFCPVYAVRANSQPQPNPSEVDDWQWVDWQWYIDQLAQDPNDYSLPLQHADAAKWSWWAKDQLIQLSAPEASAILKPFIYPR